MGLLGVPEILGLLDLCMGSLRRKRWCERHFEKIGCESFVRGSGTDFAVVSLRQPWYEVNK